MRLRLAALANSANAQVEYLRDAWPRLARWNRTTWDALSRSRDKVSIAAMHGLVTGKRRRFVLVVLCAVTVMVATGVARAYDVQETLTMPPNNLGLVGHWTFDGPTINGTTVTDVSGQGDNGTMVNGPMPVPGVEGQALSFNGSNQYVSTGLAISNTSTFTVSAWINASAIQEATFYEMAGVVTAGTNNSAQVQLGLNYPSGGSNGPEDLPYVGVKTTSGYLNAYGLNPISVHKWYLLSATYDGAHLTLYLNGVQIAQTGLTGAVMSNSYGTYIGRDIYGNTTPRFFNGSIDDVRIYNRPLSAYEIEQLYNTGTASHQNVTVNPPNLQNGLIVHWTFDGPTISGTTVADVSGNANNGTMVNNPAPAAGVLGQALSFNGTNQYVTLPNNPSLNITGPVTLAAWIKTTTTGADTIIDRYNPSLPNPGYGLIINVPAVGQYGYWSGTHLSWVGSSSTDVNDGKWHLIVASEAGGIVSFYKDGNPDGTQTTADPNSYAGVGYLASNGASAYFPGSIDDVRIYNRALSAAEVQQLYDLGTASHQNATINPPNLQGGLVSHWTFDGPTISGTTVKDVSGSGNNGTMVNSPTPVAGVLGQALSFNGTSQYVTTMQPEGFPGAVSLTAWFKTTTSYTGTSWATLVGSASGAANNLEIAIGNAGSGIGADNGAFVFAGSSSYAWANYGVTAVNDGKWHLLVGERNSSGNMLISVDGGAFVVGSNNTQPVSNDVFYVGAKNNSGTTMQYFNGSIDDVRIYNRALSAAEVKQLYNLGR